MMLATADESIRRVRSLCGSLECILTCAEEVEQNASHIGSALFLLNELKDAIQQFEGSQPYRHQGQARPLLQ